ncbi:LOG family protein [Pseudarthrobacter sp. J1738]|uniref:LOG family protein n=1 Tax=unclassified Pseudarthrobacter TaxID=2647000 RepID=UPI003D2A9DD6
MSRHSSLKPSPRSLEVESLAHFDQLVAAGARSMHGWHVQSLDLQERSAELKRLNPQGAIFLGCSFATGMDESLRSRGALLFPKLGGIDFDPYRGTLYTAGELYNGVSEHPYEETLDARVYQWSLRVGQRRSLDATLAAALHDHAIGDALEEFVETKTRRGVVGVMGGHSAQRGSDDYAQAAELGRSLAQEGFLVATGGGPGAMEAANLGALMSAGPDADLQAALKSLAQVPSFRPSISAWARAAQNVVNSVPSPVASLGIPTWFYGHEPPNLFASGIAKYFANSIREAILLELCTGGIVFLPGAAGTVQEVFQDACENYYGTPETVRPMVLVGRTYWQNKVPVWQLLSSLAAGKPMERHVHLVDTVADAVELLRSK